MTDVQRSKGQEVIRGWSIPEPNTGCWLWARAALRAGYGIAVVDGRRWYTHRLAYEAYVGPIGPMQVCHKCDTPACVNPDHLFLGTQRDNMRDMIAKGRKRNACGDENGTRLRPEPRPRGDRHPTAKLTNEIIPILRARAAAGETTRALAREYGVTGPVVWFAIRGVTWKHIPL
jgi:hypothetical protein